MKSDLRLRGFASGVASLLVLLCLAAPTAIGAPITYVFSGPASGTLGATPFTGAQTTVTATADTANVTVNAGSDPCINLTSVAINIAGVGSAATTGPNVMFDNTGTQIWGFENGTCAVGLADWLDIINPQAATYGLVTAIGPTTGAASLRNSVATTAGTLTFTAPPLTFQATIAAAAPIPTLSQWAFILLGLALTCVAVYFLRGRTLLRR